MAVKSLVLALALFAVVGLATAADKAAAADKPKETAAAPISPPEASHEGAAAGAPVNEDAIGTTDGDSDAAAAAPGDDDVAVAGPLGSESTYANYPPTESPAEAAGAAALTISSMAGAAAISASFFLF